MDANDFKFRLYDRKLKRYGLPLYTYSSPDGITTLIAPASDDKNQYVIEQYIDRYDSKGQMLFVGDVVEDLMGIKYVIAWNGYAFVLEPIDKSTNKGIMKWDSKCVVKIGNIHDFGEKIDSK